MRDSRAGFVQASPRLAVRLTLPQPPTPFLRTPAPALAPSPAHSCPCPWPRLYTHALPSDPAPVPAPCPWPHCYAPLHLPTPPALLLRPPAPALLPRRFVVQHTVEENVHRLAQQRAAHMDDSGGARGGARGGTGGARDAGARDGSGPALTVMDVAALLHASWQP